MRTNLRGVFVIAALIAFIEASVPAIVNTIDVYPTCAPAGWKIQVRGDRWRFVFPGDIESLFTNSSPSESIKASWRQYEYGRRMDARWTTVNPCKETKP